MSMGFWDAPEHHPTIGWPVGQAQEGTITALEVARNSWGNLALKYALDGRTAWANRMLWATLAQARVDVGDRVRITKTGEDQSNGKVRSSWTVERLAPSAPPHLQAPVQHVSVGPSW